MRLPEPSLEPLRAHGSPLAVALTDALERAAADRLDPEERALSDRIEALRGDLLQRADLLDPAEDEHLTVADATRASVPRTKATVLLATIRAARPTHCLELGTNVGISAAYQAGALALDGSGRLVTLERWVRRAAIARQLLDRLGLANVEVEIGRFRETLAGALEQLGRLDYSFVDGHHQEKPTLDYFAAISERISRPGYAFFDDIHWSEEMESAWAQICADPRVTLAVPLDRMGLCLFE